MTNYLTPTEQALGTLLDQDDWLDHSQNWNWWAALQMGGHPLATMPRGTELGNWSWFASKVGTTPITGTASITFDLRTLPERARAFRILASGLRTDRAAAPWDAVFMQINGDSAATYYYNFVRQMDISGLVYNETLATVSGIQVVRGAAAVTADSGCWGGFELTIWNPFYQGTYGFPYMTWRSTASSETTGELSICNGIGHYYQAGRIDSITLLPRFGTAFFDTLEELVVDCYYTMGAEA